MTGEVSILVKDILDNMKKAESFVGMMSRETFLEG